MLPAEKVVVDGVVVAAVGEVGRLGRGGVTGGQVAGVGRHEEPCTEQKKNDE